MIDGKKVLAIIPARSGSKRLPGKNIKKLSGKPLIQWTIESALNSRYIDEIAISTDCKFVVDIAKQNNIQVPFLRPKELAQDSSTTIDVVVHTLNHYQAKGEPFELVVLLQPTSPLRTSMHIDDGLELSCHKDATSVISVCEAEHSPIWANTLPEDCSMSNFLPREYVNVRSQDIKTFYRLNGSLYISKAKHLLKTKSFFADEKTFAFKMSQEDSVDIDTMLDFQLAEVLFKNRQCLN